MVQETFGLFTVYNTVYADDLLTYCTGEPFTQEEMEEMLSAALNPETGLVVCKDFVPQMLVEDNS